MISYKIYSNIKNCLFNSDINKISDIYNLTSFYIPYLNILVKHKNIVIIAAIKHNKTIGIIALNYSSFGYKEIGYKEIGYKNINWAIFAIGTSPIFCNQGVATGLIYRVFEFCMHESISIIAQSSYTRIGKDRLFHKFTRISASYPSVKLIDNGSVINPTEPKK